MRHAAGFVAQSIGKKWPWFNRMTYRPFKGARRGYWYRLPWNRRPVEMYAAL